MHPNGSNGKAPVDRALELFVYAPVGLALMAWRTVPKVPTLVGQLVSRGCVQLGEAEARLAGQVRQARMIGQVAIAYGGRQVRREVDTRLADARRRAEELAGRLPGLGGDEDEDLLADGGRPIVPRPAPAAPTAARSSAAAPTAGARTAKTGATGPAKTGTTGPAKTGTAKAAAGWRAAGPAGRSARPPSAAELAIPEYDGLSASQVVSRLTGLLPGELEAVRAYEAAGRGRKTVLAAIDRLRQ